MGFAYCCNTHDTFIDKMDVTTFLTVIALIHGALYFTDQFLKVSFELPKIYF